MTGVVDYIAPQRGFGYIRANGTERTYWFHVTALVGLRFNDIEPGDRVDFDIGDDDRGEIAVRVRPVSFG